tara:strand:- start:452 stop:2356 length:1905 start_codon:yes stop_codon:yes gene_type:complete
MIKIIEDSGQDVMHIILTTNSLCGNAQFMHRVSNIKSGTYTVAVISSKKVIKPGNNANGCTTVHYKDMKSFGWSIMNHKSKLPKVVLLCCNSKQLDAVRDLSNRIPDINSDLNLNIYIDEFHKNCPNKTKRLIEDIIDLDHVSCIYGSSATFAPILEQQGLFQTVDLITPSNRETENYVGIDDLNIKIVENVSKSKKATKLLDYIEHVYDENPHLLSDNKIGFVPGHLAISSHTTIMKIVQTLNENVVVIINNSQMKCISYIEDGREVLIPINLTYSEMCDSISSILNTHNLMNRPIVFTGFTCINIAQTLVNEDIGSFHYAIIAHETPSSSNISQLLGRLYGHQKHWGEKYRVTDVYCPNETYQKAKQEHDHHKKIQDENYSVPLTKQNYYSSNRIEHDTDGEFADSNVPKVDDRVYVLFNTPKEAVDFVNKAVFDQLYMFAKHFVSDTTFSQGKSAKTLGGTGTNLTIDELLQQYSKLKTRNGVVRKSVVIDNSETRWVVYWQYNDLIDSIKDNHIHDRSDKIRQYILTNRYIVEGPGAAYYHDDVYTNDADEKEVRDEPGVGEMKHGSSEPQHHQDYEHLLHDEIAECKNTMRVNVEEYAYECEPELPAGQTIAVEDNSNTNPDDVKCIII